MQIYIMKLYKLYEDVLPGGRGDDLPDDKFEEDQLDAGIKVELEHTKDKKLAKEIAKDHLSEDPNYYKKLKTIHKD